MFSENFKVKILLIALKSFAYVFILLQIETIFQRIPQGVNHINRHQLSNTNGCRNNAHPRDSSFSFNLINNNASTNNNNINQQSSNHTVVEPLHQSHSSDSALLRNVSAGHRYPSINNDNLHRRSENYQTTSEGSTSPESSSESSAEEWESGE